MLEHTRTQQAETALPILSRLSQFIICKFDDFCCIVFNAHILLSPISAGRAELSCSSVDFQPGYLELSSLLLLYSAHISYVIRAATAGNVL